MTRNKKLSLQLFSAVLLIVIGCGLLVAGFIVSPLGIIHPSVLTAFGEACTFGGSLFGIEYAYKYKSKKLSDHEESTECDK